MPALFVGHGNPLNALERNAWTDGWRQLAARLPRPRAVLSISAHWYVPGGRVTDNKEPPTIHDFGGFPPELYRVEYPAPGSPELAERVAELMLPMTIAQDPNWGLDHGTWSVLAHVFPQADIPVLQLSLDYGRPPAEHFALGQQLRALREQGVLIVGSGNIVHNLRAINFHQPDLAYDWANRFDADVQRFLEAGDDKALTEYERHPDGRLAVPTPDHYLPMLYIAGLRRTDDELSVLVDGVDLGSISMTAFRLG